MKNTIIIIFISLIFFKVSEAEIVNNPVDPNFQDQTSFFPKEKSLEDGYRINPDSWRFLDASRKTKFVLEGIKEIKEKEGCSFKNNVKTDSLVDSLDKTMKTLAFTGAKTAAIGILFSILDNNGLLECEQKGFIWMKEEIMKYARNTDSPTVETGKTYNGYTELYEKDGNWFMGENPPGEGEICQHFIHKNYTVYPRGLVMLSGNYPLDYVYKINSIKEINSFLQNSGFTAHYYEVSFEVVKRNKR